ncbi:MAG: T9SS type A sorting domain-containing protein [Bacteroidetes bacterium]|nr:T9SS type A sorting domain-containing protein [Bacteroidota bacterium]
MKKIGQTLRSCIAPAIIGLAALLPSKLDAQSSDFMKSIPVYGPSPATTIPIVIKNGPTPLEVVGNPFSQPNIQDYLGRKHLDWYGSGDVNNDGKIDSLDATAIDTAKTDKADIDGDGVPGTQNDKQILLNYLGRKIPYLPGHWNELTTRDERVSWLEKMIKIDNFSSKTLPLMQDSGWVCADIVVQNIINFYGISNIDNFVKKNRTYSGHNFFKNNAARFNIPVYLATTISDLGTGHGVNAVLVGDSLGSMDPLNFKNLYFWSDYGGFLSKNIKPGDGQMKDGPVALGSEVYWQNPVSREHQFAAVPEIISFNLTNGTPTLKHYGPYLTLNNPNIIKVHVGNLEKIVVDSGKFPDGTALTPGVLEGKGYKAIPDTMKKNTALPINLSYYDGETTKLAPSKLGGSHYQFLRKFFSWIYSGGITKKDSTTQIIEVDKLTAIETSGLEIPDEFKLYQNYPNPFNPTTKISYSLPEANFVTLKIYDMLGREVSTLVNEMKPSGTFEAEFDASKLSSGTYVYKLTAGSYQSVKKMILTK